MSGYPSIRISQHQRFSSPPRHSSFSATAAPMVIPRAQEAVPPPLPPPQYIPEIATGRDPGWQWGNDPNGSDFGKPASVKPGSSLLGGALSSRSSRQEKEHDYPYIASNNVRRGSSISTVTISRDHEMLDVGSLTPGEDESLSRHSSNHRLQGERQLEQRTLEESSNTYDKHLLSRIGGPIALPNTPKRTSVSYAVSEGIQLPPGEAERRNSQLRPLSMPERWQTSLDSPTSSRWPSSGAVSPGFTGFWAEHGPPAETSRTQTSTTRQGSLTFDDSVSQRSSYDHSMFVQDDLADERQMSNLNVHDRSPGSSDDFQPGARAGTKRRASSPPHDPSKTERSSVSSASGQSEIYHRRSIQTLPNRGSPVSRFHPHHSSLSSASSYGPRHNSLGSSLGIASIPSSATSYGSAAGRLSPHALSPAFDPDFRMCAPKAINQAGSSHSSHQQGVFICECCPKKPKKFDAEEDLRLHESEKQYTCAYCPNRFKNKNEAERHQNSLHLRRHSWSCAALAGVEAAFHSSSSGTDADVCGFCGEEFTNPPQWDVRAEHLNHVHKFGECNQAKKFFRADHFRQHLKHSHAGTSGKWTNMLEIACMKDEPLPEKRSVGAAFLPSVQAPPALMISTSSPLPQGGGPGEGAMLT